MTKQICEYLHPEDTVIQSMEDVSPPKWHLAHTTWFFETFLLIPFVKGYTLYQESFNFLFNSYYKEIGEHILRSDRGILSRPSIKNIYSYRDKVDEDIQKLLNLESKETINILKKIKIGIHHEKQHQELLLTDIKHILFSNPTRPIYRPLKKFDTKKNIKKIYSQSSIKLGQNLSIIKNQEIHQDYIYFKGGLTLIGAKEDSFAYDNEFCEHKYYLNSFFLKKTSVTNLEYLEFIEDGGYDKSRYWLSDGWDIIKKEKWKAPLYWVKNDNIWYEYQLRNFSQLDPNSPVCHISFFEADAFAKWSGKRLPTEFEWEFACKTSNIMKFKINSNFLENDLLHPISEIDKFKSLNFQHLLGNLWEWTNSSYLPYPSFKPLTGALGEYNGKFMNAQRILRGGSSVTSISHIRPTYRNFLQANKRWQFTGIRLASNP